MNDRDVELRLRGELQRMVSDRDAPAQLVDHVSRLGEGDSTASYEWRAFSAVHPAAMDHAFPGGRASRDQALFVPRWTRYEARRTHAGLWPVAALAVVALLAAAIGWRFTHLTSLEPTGTATAEPSRPPTPTPFPTWSGAPAVVLSGGRAGTDFGWIQTRSPDRLYVTEDGGNTWRDATPPDLAGSFGAGPTPSTGAVGPHGVTFADALHGHFFFERRNGQDRAGRALYEHSFYRTADGGRTWTRAEFPAAGACTYTDDDWLDDQNGFVQCRAGLKAQLWSTSDGGAAWTQVSSADASNPKVTWPVTMRFESTLDGWGYSLTNPPGPSLLRTTDGGETWTASQLPTGEHSGFGFAQFPTSSGGGLVAGGLAGTSEADGRLSWDFLTWVSSDGGAQWAAGASTHLGIVQLLDLGGRADGKITLFDSDARVVRLFDTSTRSFGPDIDVSGFCARAAGGSIVAAWAESSQNVWAACGYGDASPYRSYLYGTTDGGKTWRPLMGAP
jgi:photosystem II stability/assembly factor-like uncharacterized protein